MWLSKISSALLLSLLAKLLPGRPKNQAEQKILKSGLCPAVMMALWMRMSILCRPTLVMILTMVMMMTRRMTRIYRGA